MRYTLPLPPSINSYWKRRRDGGVYKSPEANAWEHEAGYSIMDHKKYGTTGIVVTCELYVGRVSSDIDNRIKILLDLLEKQGIVENDKQVMELHVYKFIDHEDPRIEFEVSNWVQR